MSSWDATYFGKNSVRLVKFYPTLVSHISYMDLFHPNLNEYAIQLGITSIVRHNINEGVGFSSSGKESDVLKVNFEGSIRDVLLRYEMYL